MAKIYGRAYRVLVWLGEEVEGTTTAFEAIRARKIIEDDPVQKEAVLDLLNRAWFRRIWVLQEVAAARRITITCGTHWLDEYQFCIGLKALQFLYNASPDLWNRIRSVTFLIRQANFRPTHGVAWEDLSFLKTRPLGQLLDMYHRHLATERHDKVYALLGMRSDALNAEDLEPNYNIPWSQLYRRVVQLLLSLDDEAGITTSDDNEVAVLTRNVKIFGQITSVSPRSGWGDEQTIDVFTTLSGDTDKEGDWIIRKLVLHLSAKTVQPGDLLCFVQGASKPTIIRGSKDCLTVIMITATLKGIPPESWQRLPYRKLTLIWDWSNGTKTSESESVPFWWLCYHGDSAVSKLQNAIILEKVGLILKRLGISTVAEEMFALAVQASPFLFGYDQPPQPSLLKISFPKYMDKMKWNEIDDVTQQFLDANRRLNGSELIDKGFRVVAPCISYYQSGCIHDFARAYEAVVEVRDGSGEYELFDTVLFRKEFAAIFWDQATFSGFENIKKDIVGMRYRLLTRNRAANFRLLEPLAYQIISLYEEDTLSKRPRAYLSESSISELLTPEAISEELETDGNASSFISWILEKARRIFLATIQCSWGPQFSLLVLKQFCKHDFNDAQLPIGDPKEDSILSILRSKDVFDPKLWDNSGLRNFYDKQWTFLAPVFIPERYYYDLSPDCILPFRVDSVDECYTRSELCYMYKVTVHPAHSKHKWSKEVFLKEFNTIRGTRTKSVWEEEASALLSINELNHIHIAKCMAALRYGDKRYLMFPCLDGHSLQDYWEMAPAALQFGPKEDIIQQMINQLRGLADAVCILQDLNSTNLGNIVPENILRIPDEQASRGIGTLMIASHLTRPGYGIENQATPRMFTGLDDVRSLACVTLEFITWIVYGNHSRHQLVNLLKLYRQTFDLSQDPATIEALVLWMDNLQNSEAVITHDSAISDLLGIVRKSLLSSPFLRNAYQFQRALYGIIFLIELDGHVLRVVTYE